MTDKRITDELAQELDQPRKARAALDAATAELVRLADAVDARLSDYYRAAEAYQAGLSSDVRSAWRRYRSAWRDYSHAADRQRSALDDHLDDHLDATMSLDQWSAERPLKRE